MSIFKIVCSDQNYNIYGENGGNEYECYIMQSILLKDLRIPDIHDFISDMVLLHAKNKAVSLKVANSVVHKVDRSPMYTLMSIPKKR